MATRTITHTYTETEVVLPLEIRERGGNTHIKCVRLHSDGHGCDKSWKVVPGQYWLNGRDLEEAIKHVKKEDDENEQSRG